MGANPAGASITPDGSHLYVTNSGDDTVSVIDVSSSTVIDTIAVGDDPLAYGQFIGPQPACSNGFVETSEGCDDANATAGDGCNATCQVESCHQCTGEPSACTCSGAPCGAICGRTLRCSVSAAGVCGCGCAIGNCTR